jgi:bifunctional DNase/RNase
VNGEVIEIDSRPSDAIALSVHFDPVLPIYVEDSVLGEVA